MPTYENEQTGFNIFDLIDNELQRLHEISPLSKNDDWAKTKIELFHAAIVAERGGK